MAEIWVAAAATVVVGAYSANQSKKSAQGAANSQAASQQMAIDEQRREYDQSRADQLPFLQAGHNAVGLQQAYLNGDTSGFDQSPDYLFRLQQGLQSQERGAAARGGFMGGGADADRIALAQGIAAQGANDYWAKLAGQAGQGYNSANSLGNLGASAASNIGNAYGNIGNARASSYGATADANSQMAAGIGNAFTSWYGQNKANNPGGTGWYLGNQPGKG